MTVNDRRGSARSDVVKHNSSLGTQANNLLCPERGLIGRGSFFPAIT
jgi:hypothetical protein